MNSSAGEAVNNANPHELTVLEFAREIIWAAGHDAGEDHIALETDGALKDGLNKITTNCLSVDRRGGTRCAVDWGRKEPNVEFRVVFGGGFRGREPEAGGV